MKKIIVLIFVMLFSTLQFGELWALPDEEAEAMEAIAPVEEEKVEEILDIIERRYVLLRREHWELEYNLTYGYLSHYTIIPVSPTLAIYEDEKQHTFTSSISVNYGLRDNLQLGMRLPYIYKYEDVDNIRETELGDISFGLQYQPVIREGLPTIILHASFKTKTGRSPFEINPELELATGSGYYSLEIGMNLSKVLDPLVVFGGISYGYNFKVKNLHQTLPGVGVLEEVEPGDTINFNMGIAYALSPDVSVNLIWSQSYSFRTDFLIDGSKVRGLPRNSATLQIGTGWRLSPRTTLHVSVGHGLTPDAPDFFVSFRLPFGFFEE